jgi:hypothetical protein
MLSPPFEITNKARPAKIANPTAIFHIVFSKKNIVIQVWSNPLIEVRARGRWESILIGVRSTLIWSIEGGKGKGGAISGVRSTLIFMIQRYLSTEKINVDLTPFIVSPLCLYPL